MKHSIRVVMKSGYSFSFLCDSMKTKSAGANCLDIPMRVLRQTDLCIFALKMWMQSLTRVKQRMVSDVRISDNAAQNRPVDSACKR